MDDPGSAPARTVSSPQGIAEVTSARAEQRIRELESSLSQAAQAAGVALLLRAFLHELSSPLGTILLYGELLSQRSTEPYAIERLERILEAGRRCQHLVQQLSAIAHPSPQGPSWFDLPVLVDEALIILASQMATHDLSLVREIDPSIPQLHGMRGDLGLAILHSLAYIVQSLAAAGAGGQITIAGSASSDTSASLTIHGQGLRPTGAGRAELDLEAVGRHFGLLAAQAAVERNGGHFSVEESQHDNIRLIIEIPPGTG